MHGQSITLRRCIGCEQHLPIDRFYIQTGYNGKPYPMSRCKSCNVVKVREWSRSAKAKARRRENDLAKKFKLTPAAYDAMLAAQGDVCAICRNPETHPGHSGTPRRLVVDHDHDTGMVRGILCSRCNQGVGYFSDSIATLEAAIAYLKKHHES